MAQGLLEIARSFRDALVGFDPTLLSGDDCATVVEQLAVTEKACAAARARAAVRAGDCGVHRRRGFRRAGEWLAHSTGSSPGEARAALETAAEVERLPQTRKAMAAGELSLAQAGVIARTEAECQGAEAELLDLAHRFGLAELKDRARTRRLEAMPVQELHRRQHKARALRHWRDELGMVRLDAVLPPEVGVGLVNRLDAEGDRIRRTARGEGSDDSREAHAADALVKLLSGLGTVGAQRADVVLVCDLFAYRRGHTHAGEVCQIVGGGPVPVSVVRDMAADGFVKAVLHDGVRIHTVKHFGRHIPAEVRTALELGPVPAFGGAECIVEGCGHRYGLQWDHVDPVANGGPTSYGNLEPRCKPDHWDKTARDREAGLLGGARHRGGPP